MNSGVLRFDGAGQIRNTLSAVLPAAMNFNGGTPTRASDGALCLSSGPITDRLGGFSYNANGALCINLVGTVAGYVQGLPVDSQGDILAEVAAVASYSGAFPLTANGRLALAAATALAGFDSGFDGGYG